jgi:hypothetical protein
MEEEMMVVCTEVEGNRSEFSHHPLNLQQTVGELPRVFPSSIKSSANCWVRTGINKSFVSFASLKYVCKCQT